jgi:type I restriction enzyme M protein
VDITETARDLIVQVYGNYQDGTFEAKTQDGKTVVCKSKVLDVVSFGYNKITVESPLLDEHGNKVIKNRNPVPDPDKRDTEDVPLDEDIDAYFKREVVPYNPDAWIDKSKTKVGYEIPFTKTFYEYKQLEPADVIAKRIEEHERLLIEKLETLFGKESK